MMNEAAVRSWIAVGDKVAWELAEADPTQRQAVLERAAGSVSKIKSLRRMIRAVGHLRALVKSERMTLSEVRASMSAVENLERLNRRAPHLAAPIRARVLRGEVGHRELLRLERDTGPRVSVRSPSPDLDELGGRLYGFLIGQAEGYILSSAERVGHSETAKLLKVDYEVLSEDGSTAVFLSPSIDVSEGRGGALDDHLLRAIAAQAFFDRVVMVVADKRERHRVENYKHLSEHPERFELLTVYELGEVPPIEGDRSSAI